MAKEEPNEKYDSPLNINLPEKLNKALHHSAYDLGMSLQGATAKGLRLLLYFKANFGTDDISVQQIKKMVDESYPIICLKTARNDLAKRNYDTTSLDAEIAKAEAYLQR